MGFVLYWKYSKFQPPRKDQKMLKYYIFRIEYSQTDQTMIIVQAESREQAEKYLKRNGDRGPRYVTYYGEQENIPVAK